MRVNPVSPAFYSADKDDRHEAEKRRISLLLKILEGMEVPSFRVMGLSLPTQRLSALRWLSRNLAVKNSSHRSFNQAINLISLLISCELRKINERV
tara:strand:- start:2375 stop:2662 length:288 start_codon:yes stop_codon:yes gene_type:complete